MWGGKHSDLYMRSDSLFKILPCTINDCCYFYTADYVLAEVWGWSGRSNGF